MNKYTENSEIIEGSPEYSTIVAVPKKLVNKFLKSFFNSIENCTLLVDDSTNVNVAIIPIVSNENTELNNLNLKMMKEYNNFIRNEFNKDPKFYNRNMVYESEVKDNKLFIRWA